MLVECIQGEPIKVDGKARLQNVRINLASKHQLRSKMEFINDADSVIPVDMVIYDFSYPRISLNSKGMEMDIIGEEYIRHIHFKLKVSYNFIKNIWVVDGIINEQPITQVVSKSSFKVVIEVIKVIIKNKI